MEEEAGTVSLLYLLIVRFSCAGLVAQVLVAQVLVAQVLVAQVLVAQVLAAQVLVAQVLAAQLLVAQGSVEHVFSCAAFRGANLNLVTKEIWCG